MIWDEVGEDQFEREKILLDLEQECLEVYRRKVDYANMARARLHQELALAESESTHLLLSLGERSLPGRPEKKAGTLKQQLESITPALREMRLRKQERMNQFRAVQGQTLKISAEIEGRSEHDDSASTLMVNENDLSLKKLEECQAELKRLQNEKSDRLQRVEMYISTIRNLSATLGTDFSMTITKIHPSLNELCGIAKNISDEIMAKLSSTVESLEEEKRNRFDKLRDLSKALLDLWSLMDTAEEDRKLFTHLTNLLSVSASQVSDPGNLAISIIQQAEAEVERLDQLKASKMKELFLRKQFELEEICNESHMEIPSKLNMENLLSLTNSREINHANLLTSMDEQILKAREEASSRKVIMEKVEKWIQARDEERWLEEYNRDDNRYSVSRGAHRNLKRAERARITVSKIPALVELLVAKTKNWEEERKKVFLYDEVPLLSMLEEYNLLRQEREQGQQRLRMEKKKAQTQAMASVEPDSGFSIRPGTSSRRIPNRSLIGGFGSASPVNRRTTQSVQQIGSNSIYSPTKSMNLTPEHRLPVPRKLHSKPDFASLLREETSPAVSAFSGPYTS
ncbi:hypothetical protein V2J09_013201 [Rumex salicifolius]